MTDDLMIIEFVEDYAGYELSKVVMFNRKHISEKDVDRLIHSGRVEQSNDVVVMTKQQYINLGGHNENEL